jgi:hypothetical protein
MLMHGERSARLKPKFQTWRNNRAEPVSQDVSTMRPGPVLGQSDASSVHNVKVHSDNQPQPVIENLSSHPPLPRSKFWWSQSGSNRRPPACKAGALPAELWPRGHAVVGLGRFELPTSRLSGVRSNQLSYRPETPRADVCPGEPVRTLAARITTDAVMRADLERETKTAAIRRFGAAVRSAELYWILSA